MTKHSRRSWAPRCSKINRCKRAGDIFWQIHMLQLLNNVHNCTQSIPLINTLQQLTVTDTWEWAISKSSRSNFLVNQSVFCFMISPPPWGGRSPVLQTFPGMYLAAPGSQYHLPADEPRLFLFQLLHLSFSSPADWNSAPFLCLCRGRVSAASHKRSDYSRCNNVQVRPSMPTPQIWWLSEEHWIHFLPLPRASHMT